MVRENVLNELGTADVITFPKTKINKIHHTIKTSQFIHRYDK